MRTILLTTGLACVIAALAGGGLKAFGIEISVLNSIRRQVALGAFGGAVALLAFTRYGEPEGYPSFADTTRHSPTHKNSKDKHPPALPGGGDTIAVVSVLPRPGAILRRGKPVTFQVGLRYKLTSVDEAQIALDFPEFVVEAGGCHVGRGGLGFDEGNHFPVLRGERETVVAAIWSGDDPSLSLSPNPKVKFIPGLGKGYVGVRAGFLVSGVPVKSFGPFSEYCYLFH